MTVANWNQSNEICDVGSGGDGSNEGGVPTKGGSVVLAVTTDEFGYACTGWYWNACTLEWFLGCTGGILFDLEIGEFWKFKLD